MGGGPRNTCGDNTYPKWPAYDVSNPLNFFALLNEGLKHNPPHGADLAILGMFETLNIGPNKSFDAARLDPATAAGLKRALEVGPQLLAADFKARVGQVINGWNFTSNLGNWRTPDTDQLDFLLRSAIAKDAQPGQNPSEAVYPFTFNDVDGKPLTGANRYVVRFVKGNLPRSMHFGRSPSTMRRGSWSRILSTATRSGLTTTSSRTRTGRSPSTFSATAPGRTRKATGCHHPTGCSTLHCVSTTPAPRLSQWTGRRRQ